MKGLKIIWGVLLVCALLLAFRAVTVFTPAGSAGGAIGLMSEIGKALVIGAAKSLNHVTAYLDGLRSGQIGASLPERIMLEFSVNRYASGAEIETDALPAEDVQLTEDVLITDNVQLAEDADDTGTRITGEDAESFFLLGDSGLIPELPGSGNNRETDESLPVEYAEGEVEPVVSQTIYPDWNVRFEALFPLEQMRDLTYLLNNFYIVDSSTSASAKEFDLDTLLSVDLTIEKQSGSPQILIYHTHASEGYIDSREGNYEDTVMGVGDYLTEILTTQYGYEVYHDQNVYDRKNGRDNRNYAYTTALPYITKILEENPSIEVVIDLHRDGGAKRVTEIDGKQVARIMLFNGMCRNANGPLADLENPYKQENLAFSLRMNLIGQVLYPGLMFKIYLKNYRYNMHLSPKSLLVELGTNENTLEEAMNAMPYFAQILDQVLNSR